MDVELRALLSSGSITFVRHWVIDVCGGDIKAAIILDKLLWWAKDHEDRPGSLWGAEHEGYWWSAMSYDNWWHEVRINSHSAKRAIAHLREKGFVVTAEFKFFDTKKLHLRVVEKNVVSKAKEYGLLVSPSPRPPSAKAASQTRVRSVPHQEDKTYSSHIQERTTERTPAPEKSGAEERADTPREKPREAEAKDPKDEQADDKVVPPTDRDQEWNERQAEEEVRARCTPIEVLRMKAHEALKQDSTNNGPGRKNYTATGQAAAILWKKHVHLATGEFVKDFTRQDQKMMKRLVEVIQIAVPLGNAIDVLDWTLSNWGLFCHKVGVTTGATGNPPSLPNLLYLNKHYAIAVNLYNATKRAVVEQPSPEPQPPSTAEPDAQAAPAAEAPPAQPKEDVHIVTPQEMEEAMKEFDSNLQSAQPQTPPPAPESGDNTPKAA